MENVVSKVFDSPLDLGEMLARLDARVGGVEWAIRESEYDGRYVKGTTGEGVKIRIVEGDFAGKYSVEVYFPLTPLAEPALSNADKRAFMKRLDGHVLAAVEARNVKDEE